MANVTKVLGGVEDLMFGTGVASQARAGANYNINKIDKPHPVSTKAALKLLPIDNANIYYRTVLLLGNTVAGDNGAGLFYHDPAYAHASADDYDIIIDSSAGLNGCWRRIIPSVKKEYRGSYTSAGTGVGLFLDVAHSLGTDDVEFGGAIFGASGIALGGLNVEGIIIAPDGRFVRVGQTTGTATVIALPASGSVRLNLYNNYGSAQNVTMKYWIRVRN